MLLVASNKGNTRFVFTCLVTRLKGNLDILLRLNDPSKLFINYLFLYQPVVNKFMLTVALICLYRLYYYRVFIIAGV